MPGRSLLVRADASAEMGVGHVMRCIALAEAWRKTGGLAYFVMAAGARELGRRVHSSGSELIVIDSEPGSEADADSTLIAGQHHGKDWLVLDGYHFPSEYIARVSKAASHFLIMADGERAPEFDGDLLVNPEPGVSKIAYRTASHRGELLLGSKYALVRSEFLEYPMPAKRIPETATRLLITLGGGDVDNVTLRVLVALDKITERELDITVVLGAANPHKVSLVAAATKARHSVKLIFDADNMPELMSRAEFAVAGGGGTCCELAFMRVPMILITIAKNQEPAVNAYDRTGSAMVAGWLHELDESKFVGMMRTMISDSALRERLAENAGKMVDGKGADRIVEQMLAISAFADKLTGIRS